MGGSDSGGGNDTGGYDAAPMQYTQRKRQRQRIQQDVMRQQEASGQSAYATDRSRTSTVKSSSGQSVMTSAGRAMEQQARQNELDRTVGSGTGSETLQQRKTNIAVMQMKDRLSKLRFPNTLNIVAAENLKRQIAQLEGGKAQATFRMSRSGRFVATGTKALGKDGSYSTRDVEPIFRESDYAGTESDSPVGVGGISGDATEDKSKPTEGTDLSKAARRAQAQAQKGVKARTFYNNQRSSLS